MAVAGWVFSLAALLHLTVTVTHSHSGEIDTYHVSAGHLFLLKCYIPGAHANITWSKVGRHNRSLPAGVEVQDGFLWFTPLQASHNGTYICEKRTEDGPSSMKLGVSVSSEECPDPTATESMTLGVSGGLPCQQTEIFRLNNTRTIRWLKDCQPLEHLDRQGEPVSVEENGFMRLPKASERDAGKYTCLVEISVDGRKYTSAYSIQLTIDNVPTDKIYKVPHVLFPIQEVFKVVVGASLELKCEADIGFSENTVNVFWTVNGSFTEDYDELHESYDFIKAKGRVHSRSTLSISKVLHQFLNVPIHCCVMSSAGMSHGLVQLQEADHRVYYAIVAFCLTPFLTLLTLAAVFHFFRIDLVLVYREMVTRLFKQPPDGKLYDAYVSFLHTDSLSSAERFALQVLPEKLEKQHGYSLYIRGRDDCPGEAMHDLIDATLRSCRRLIIILTAESKYSTDAKTDECLFHHDQNQLCYEQKVGLHDSLIRNEPQVILVEVDGPVDYSQLPESLQFVKRRQGALKWKAASPGTYKFNSNRCFWKNLRYHMPSAPAGTHPFVV